MSCLLPLSCVLISYRDTSIVWYVPGMVCTWYGMYLFFYPWGPVFFVGFSDNEPLLLAVFFCFFRELDSRNIIFIVVQDTP